MARPRLASVAEAEFTDALCWYAERSPRAANDFDADFDRPLQAIEEQPTRFPRCDDRHRFYLMRRFPYQIIYRVEKDAVTVVAVAHASRSPGYWTDR